jgi:hypothetical protein
MKQAVLAGVVAGALAVGFAGTAGAQANGGRGVSDPQGAAQTGDAKATGGQTAGAKTTGAKAAGATSLGSVRITRAVKANGERLAPGTYTVRLTEEQARPEAKGQDPAKERWVEFVQGNQVKGREVVSIVPESDIPQVSEGKRVPRGSARVEMLKDNEYLRVWINRGGNNYLIHLPPA